MTLRLSEHGPEFPGELIDAVLAGEVVFLCGTGVSAPQMPGFKALVDCTFKVLAVEKTDSEKQAFEMGRFEEVLGSLSRRLADPGAVPDTVSGLLAIPERPALEQHRVIFRLSRDLHNRVAVITTNFDTLFERAAAMESPNEKPAEISFAGQALPAPGTPSFAGIIHLHGRLADKSCELDPTPLVLTSADYGDAYMRSGWASRFLFDLARCKVIALVGYSAQDAPVRYFLNVLEADRARFPDLKPVYALDGYEHDPEETFRAWETLAVNPLPYCKINPASGKRDHAPLWRDLSKLADIVDRPKRWREQRAKELLQSPSQDVDDDARRELRWMFGGRRDLWPTALAEVSDSGWFSVFDELSLWPDDGELASQLIAAWVAQDFQDLGRLECACEWQPKLGHAFTSSILQHFLSADGVAENWVHIWRYFCLAAPGPRDDADFYQAEKQLAGPVVLDRDLIDAVRLLAPRLVLEPSFREFNAEKPVERLADVVAPAMRVGAPYGAGRLVEALSAMANRAGRILELATSELTATLELQKGLELITDEYDANDWRLPSIENHSQNEHIEGVKYLVGVITGLLRDSGSLGREHTRQIVTEWTELPGRIGLRLCLHAMRDAALFDAEEAMAAMLDAPDLDFWAIKRETALLMRDRAGEASPTIVYKVEERICQQADIYYQRFQIAPGESDWRRPARDAAVWLRLNMLLEADALSAKGRRELCEIKERREYLDRKVEDRDFFSSYSSGARFVAGDPDPIAEAPTSDRLQVARKLAQQPDFESQEGWRAYCRSDPAGAFQTLCQGEITQANGALWNQFLETLAYVDEASKALRDDLAVSSFGHLQQVEPSVLRIMVSGLARLLFSARREQISRVDSWLKRIWDLVPDRNEESLDSTSDWYEWAINSDAGKVAETLLLEIEARITRGLGATREQSRLLRRICRRAGTSGQLGRAVLAHHLSFVVKVDPQSVSKFLGPRVNALDDEGIALRRVMVRAFPMSPELTTFMTDAMKTALIESREDSSAGLTVAANMLRPALAEIRKDAEVGWGLTANDVAQVLRKGRSGLRGDALDVLGRWLGPDDATGGENWQAAIGPFLDVHWPKERAFRTAELTAHWVELVVKAGKKFPAALEQLRPYIAPYGPGHASLQSIVSSEIPERFPLDTLQLLWLVCGPDSRGRSYRLADVLSRLAAADPRLEFDRRFQWLLQRADGYL